MLGDGAPVAPSLYCQIFKPIQTVVPHTVSNCPGPALLQRWGRPKQDQEANWVTIAVQDNIRHAQLISQHAEHYSVFLLSGVVRAPLLCDLLKESGSGL